GQSMPFYYTNTGGVASQTDRHWSTPQDWSGHGIQTLALSFYGAQGNTGDLYLKINDTKIPYPGDASDLTKLRWNPWHVDLTRLTVNSVTTLSIGVDGNGATGMILLDDILLYRSVPEQVTPVAPSAEGLVAHWTLDDEAGTSAADSAGNHTGTVSSTAQWTTGHLGGALQLDGINAYVDCGADATLDITDVITLSVWVNPADAGNGEHNPFMAKGDHAYTLKHGPGNAFEFLLYQGAWNYIQVPVTEAFNGNWYHLTGTYDGTQLKLYVNGMLGATLETGGAIDSSADAVNLGRNSEYPDRLFEGTLDDARIYNRVLSDAEILYLSNQ
ncbi:MAG: LamG domain-containing protein, partial [Planctomycetes bacterium]|nr:LamG domain-containing protein [Planctomycetota bacterium]